MYPKTIQRRKGNSKLGKNKSKKIKRGGANTTRNAQIATLMGEGLAFDEARAICENERPRPDIYSPNVEPGGGESRGGEPGGGVREGSSSVIIPDHHKSLRYVDVKTELLATFKMDNKKKDDIFRNFQEKIKQKKVPSNKDCVIIALDLLGLISHKTADLMRIISIDLAGISAPQIVKIMEITTDYKHTLNVFFMYKPFWEILSQLTLVENMALFCAITRIDGSKHAFIVVHFNQKIYVVDPSMLSEATELTDSGHECPSHTQGITEWYVLFRSEYKLTDDQKRQTGFINF